MKRTIASAVAAVFILGGCSSNLTIPAAKASEFKITGTITVEAGAGSDGALGGECITEGGYADIRAGAQVTVKDEAGKVVALGGLDGGHTSDARPIPAVFDSDTSTWTPESSRATKCVFGFSVAGAPGDRKFYSIEVAHRGALQYTRANLDGPLTLTLGG